MTTRDAVVLPKGGEFDKGGKGRSMVGGCFYDRTIPFVVVVDARAKMVEHRTIKHTLANGYVAERHRARRKQIER